MAAVSRFPWLRSAGPRGGPVNDEAGDPHAAVLGLSLTVNRFAQISLPIAIGAAAAPLGVLGIFWANAALLVGAMVVVAGSDAGTGIGTTEPQPPAG